MNWFAEAFPERFIQTGIAEQNLVAVASGLASMGKIPFASSYAAFNPGRNWEQIKTNICLNDQPVKIIGSHAGLMTGLDGATHQMLEDIALTRTLPNMIVICPLDSVEAEKATMTIAEDSRPTYMRLARDNSPVVTTVRTPFSLKSAQVFSPGKDITIISTGIMTYEALVAAEQLYATGIDAEVIHVPVIKPLDAVTILRSVQKTGAVITVEEAQLIGGLGSAVAELLGENLPTAMKRIGVVDRFGESGKPYELMDIFGLRSNDIVKAVHGLMTELGRQ
jgi:transketolase